MYVYNKQTLYTKKVTLADGKEYNIYFFCKKKPKSGEPCDLPEGKEIKVTKTGMIVLKNKE